VTCRLSFRHSNLTSVLRAALIIGLASFWLAGCSGPQVGGPGGLPSGGGLAPSTVQLRIGALSINRVIGLRLDVGSIQAIDAQGIPRELLANPANIEIAHLAGTTDIVSQYPLPQGTYETLLLSVSGARVTFVDDKGTPVVQDLTLDPTPQKISIATTPVIVGDSPTVVSLSVDADQTVVFDDAHTKASVNQIVLSGVSQSDIDPKKTEGGKIEKSFGLVVRVDCLLVPPTPEVPDPCASNTTGFITRKGQSKALVSFNTDGSTQLEPNALKNIGQIMDTIVAVEGYTLPNGDLFATSVNSINPSDSAQLQGMFAYSDTSGLFLVDHDGVGNGMQADYVGKNVGLDLSAASMTVQLANLAGDLDPARLCPDLALCFDESHLYPAQQVELDGDGLMPSSDDNVAFTAPGHLELKPQSISGWLMERVVYPIDPGTQTSSGPGGAIAYIDLQVFDDSYLVLMNPGVKTVRVYQFNSTMVDGGLGFSISQTASAANQIAHAASQAVRVRGLLYAPEANDNYHPGVSPAPDFFMVATRLTQ
jgi:hypothetical protein